MTVTRRLRRNIAKTPGTLSYPSAKMAPVAGMRAVVTWRSERCIGCNLCVQVCPSAAIRLLGTGPAAEITYHLDRCLFHGECIDVCPTHAIETTAEYERAFFDRDAMTQTFLRFNAPTTPGSETPEED